jgi:hypothetical protein
VRVASAADRDIERRAGPPRIRHRRAEAYGLNEFLGLHGRLDARLRLSPPRAVAKGFDLFWNCFYHFQKLRESP